MKDKATETLESLLPPLKEPKKPRPSITFRAAEQRFLARQNGGKIKGRKKVIAEALRHSTVAYFRHILDDETEKKLWYVFMTGKMAREDALGNPVMQTVTDANGNSMEVPIIDEVELNPVMWQAFKRAVEYKRGMPIVTVRDEGEASDKQQGVVFEMVGASPDFFLEQGKSTGLIK